GARHRIRRIQSSGTRLPHRPIQDGGLLAEGRLSSHLAAVSGREFREEPRARSAHQGTCGATRLYTITARAGLGAGAGAGHCLDSGYEAPPVSGGEYRGGGYHADVSRSGAHQRGRTQRSGGRESVSGGDDAITRSLTTFRQEVTTSPCAHE